MINAGIAIICNNKKEHKNLTDLQIKIGPVCSEPKDVSIHNASYFPVREKSVLY